MKTWNKPAIEELDLNRSACVIEQYDKPSGEDQQTTCDPTKHFSGHKNYGKKHHYSWGWGFPWWF